MKILKTNSLFLLCLSLFLSGCSKEAAIYVTDLSCANIENPDGIDNVIFSWKLKSDKQGTLQTAWKIEIASSEELLKQGEADIWKSGKQPSDAQFDITPEVTDFEPGKRYWWHVRIWDENSEKSLWSKPAYFSVGPRAKDWQAKWITKEWEENRTLPYIRQMFQIDNNIDYALAYVSGLGCSDLFINGKQVDDTRLLDPAQTDYNQVALYSTFDVTKQLQKGDNCIGVMLGDGWYNQDQTWTPDFSYGKPMLLLQLLIVYNDGKREIIATDESWQWHDGPVLNSNIYKGEKYDARLEVKDWSSPTSSTDGWKNTILASGVIPPTMKPQLIAPIRRYEEIKPINVWQAPSGSWIFDFGENTAANIRLKASQPKGTHLVFRMAERKNEDGSLDYTSTGVEHVGYQQDEYIFKGEGIEEWVPRFTYHGFRYVEMSGATSKLDDSWLSIQKVYNDIDITGEFECSDEQINRLHTLAMRTVLSNLHGIPTDCPTREKCGWLGDTHAYVDMANMNLDMNNFWSKYIGDIRSSSNVFLKNTLHQKLYNTEFYFADKAEGIPFMIAPGKRLCGVASPDWGTAVVQLPWLQYLYYGNKNILKDQYEYMKQWTDYIAARAQNHIVQEGLGDWCPPYYKLDTPIELSSTAFHCLDAKIMMMAAETLDKLEDFEKYKKLYEDISKALVTKFYNTESKTFGSQTADAMALDIGFAPTEDKKAISNSIIKNMKEKYDSFLNTGIFGLPRIGAALSRYGNEQGAYDLFTKKGEYSFEYMWSKWDATTLWEALPINQENGNMAKNASNNHPMQAGYDIWFYQDIAGIRPTYSGVGFKIIRFEPTMMNYFDWATATVDTRYGKVKSAWKHEAKNIIWHIEIPVNSSGEVVLPKGKKLYINELLLDETLYTVINENEKNKTLHLPSGTWEIKIQ